MVFASFPDNKRGADGSGYVSPILRRAKKRPVEARSFGKKRETTGLPHLSVCLPATQAVHGLKLRPCSKKLDLHNLASDQLYQLYFNCLK
jgi:hypothetical protein